MAYNPLNDPEFDAIKSRIDAAGDEDATEQLAADIGDRREAEEHPVRRFVTNLPKNIGIGGWKALVNTVDTLSEVAAEANPQALAAKAVGGEEMRKAASPSLSEQYPEVMDSLRNFTSDWERNDTLSDEIVQGTAQFTVPFLGWLKLLGGASNLSKASSFGKLMATEAGTVASAFQPHEGRVADLLEMGRESETRFGTLLRQIAPDESLMNNYIDYMTDRSNEGEAEGRWKNVVDSAVVSAGLAGVLKTAAGAYKFGKFALEDAGVNSFGPKQQRGMVAFHGTPHDFDAFDLSKLGTGEGNQVYGHGLYFAEAEGIAKHYRGTLSKRAFSPGSAMENAYSAMESANFDAKQAYTTLMQKAARAQDPEWRQTLTSAADKIKAGNVKQLGKLMTVDIDDVSVTKMLDYDKALSEQPDILKKLPAEDRAKLEEMLEGDIEGNGALEDLTGNQLQQLIGRAIEDDRFAFTPSQYDGNLKKYAAEYFVAHDIPGVRYLDGSSRSAAKGTRNIVLFDDKLVKITKKE